ncbi:hypothetical protein Pla123a_24930 [Posidoniimonas polymericola]|uniref:SH3b domain-containing protein n=1 Tax=Posidoniimonas polymericola TaxID=2528002 RepID=A0A5C5YQB9_9BACT|nr:hypothetical protein [Posidoniimonas polymericola]TWT77063.1 hypothetical protein Pla123a_24930 [Posidoniimonas polymericola]
MQANTTTTALVAASAVLLSTAALGGEFPYDAVVNADAAVVYAGPGPHYYDTAELPSGASVQVFEETPGGFCAIRPPEGSFSWAPASSLRLLDDGTAEVTRAETPARVGSLLHDRRDAVHVRLDRGERVRVLARQAIEGVDWVQIAPPSGEFRWVRREDLARHAPTDLDRPTPGEQVAGPTDQTDTGPVDSWVRAAAHTGQASESDAPAPAVDVVGAKPLPPVARSDASADATRRPAPLELSGGFAQRLAALEVELSRQVAERPTLWRFEEIEQQAAAMLSAAADENERQAVRELAARVDRFAGIANRYKSTRGLAPQVGLTKATVADGTAPKIEPLAPSVGPLSGYDAIGTLRPVISKRPNAPQYALVDSQGKIVSFITASPDLNLAPLIGQRVGVQGVQGFMPEYQQQHVTAQRVASLGSTVR